MQADRGHGKAARGIMTHQAWAKVPGAFSEEKPMKIEDVISEIRAQRRQINDDFQFNALAFKDMSGQFKSLAKNVNQMTANISERMSQVEGRTRLQEKRFDRMLEAVEDALVQVDLSQEMD